MIKFHTLSSFIPPLLRLSGSIAMLIISSKLTELLIMLAFHGSIAADPDQLLHDSNSLNQHDL